MNKRHYEHTLPNIRGSLSNTYVLSGYVSGTLPQYERGMISPTLGAHSVKVCIRKLNLNFTTLKVNFTMAKPQRITSSHTASWKARASLPDSAFWFMMAKAISCPLRALR